MSGHSKWATIKRKKGAADAKRGQTFTKFAKAITIAAGGGADPDTNYKLRLAIDKAKSVNMPAANIERAIERGSGGGKENQLHEVTYEGYGPGGVAVMVKCATDNKNRTLAEVRNVINKSGGNLAEPGAVAYQFTQRGVIHLTTDNIDEASLVAIDCQAEDVETDGHQLTIYTAPNQLFEVKSGLETAGFKVETAEISFEPQQPLPINDQDVARKVLKLVDDLDELDDVTAVYSNFDIPDQLLGEI